MVSRDNWKLVQRYLDYQREVLLRDKQTVDRAWASLRHFLEWANATSVANVRNVRPVFPVHLAEHGIDRVGISRACNQVRDFVHWLQEEHPKRYTRLTDNWLDTLRPAKEPERPRDRDVYSLDDIRKICALPAVTLADRRDIAAIALLFLSGIRVGALTSMPISSLHLDDLSLDQFPEMGVRTKGGKRATTYILQVHELLRVVQRWDEIVRTALPVTALWYTPLGPAGLILDGTAKATMYRRLKITRALKRLCAKADVKYRNPHKLRHGFAVYALGLAKDIGDLKAISQTLMHADLKTTDGIYGILGDEDVQTRIGGLTG
jgi:site-specific recombinase XerD